MKELIGQYITEWGWLTIAIVTFAFKDLVSNFVIGDLQIHAFDDIVYIRQWDPDTDRNHILEIMFFMYMATIENS